MRTAAAVLMSLPYCQATAPESCPEATLILSRTCPTAGTPLEGGAYTLAPPLRCQDGGFCEEAITEEIEIDGRLWLVMTCRDEMPALPDTGGYDGPWDTIEGVVCRPSIGDL